MGPDREILLTYENPTFARARAINGATLLTIMTFYPSLVNDVLTFLHSLQNKATRLAAYLSYLRDIEKLKKDIRAVLSKIKPQYGTIYATINKAKDEKLLNLVREKPRAIPYFNAQVLWSMTTLKNWNDIAREKNCFKFKGRPINLGKKGEYIRYDVEQAKEIVNEVKRNLKPDVDLDYMAKRLWECFFDALRGELKNPRYSFFKKEVIKQLQRYGIKAKLLERRVKVNSDYVGLDIKIEDKGIFIRLKGSIDPGSQPGYLKAQMWAVKDAYPVILVSDGPSLRLLDEDWGIPRCYAQPPNTRWELVEIIEKHKKDFLTKSSISTPKNSRRNLYELILEFGKANTKVDEIVRKIHEANGNNLIKTIKDLKNLPKVLAQMWNAKLITFKKSGNHVLLSATEVGRSYENRIVSYIKFNEWAPILGTVTIGCSEDALALLTIISSPSKVPEVPVREEGNLSTELEKLYKKAIISINKQTLNEFAKNVGINPRSRKKLIRAAIQAILIYTTYFSENKMPRRVWSNYLNNVIVPESKKLAILLNAYGYKYNGKRFLRLSQELNKILKK